MLQPGEGLQVYGKLVNLLQDFRADWDITPETWGPASTCGVMFLNTKPDVPYKEGVYSEVRVDVSHHQDHQDKDYDRVDLIPSHRHQRLERRVAQR